VGKSRLLARIAGHAQVDVIVACLIGERGRELNEFLEDALSPEARGRSVIVCATSDAPALERLKSAHTATAIAEYFRARGKRVLLLMDSLTRLTRAAREVGLAAGEPPTRRGFPPSAFAELGPLIERTGPRATARSPPSTQCWSRATTSTNPCPTRRAVSSTATWCSIARSRSAATSRPSTCHTACRA
jgi:type III secretion protein N (ATPase)